MRLAGCLQLPDDRAATIKAAIARLDFGTVGKQPCISLRGRVAYVVYYDQEGIARAAVVLMRKDRETMRFYVMLEQERPEYHDLPERMFKMLSPVEVAYLDGNLQRFVRRWREQCEQAIVRASLLKHRKYEVGRIYSLGYDLLFKIGDREAYTNAFRIGANKRRFEGRFDNQWIPVALTLGQRQRLR